MPPPTQSSPPARRVDTVFETRWSGGKENDAVVTSNNPNASTVRGQSPKTVASEDSFTSSNSHKSSDSTSSIDNLQAIRTVAHLGDAPLFREDGHHLGRRKVGKSVVFRGEPVGVPNRSPTLTSPPSSSAYLSALAAVPASSKQSAGRSGGQRAAHGGGGAGLRQRRSSSSSLPLSVGALVESDGNPNVRPKVPSSASGGGKEVTSQVRRLQQTRAKAGAPRLGRWAEPGSGSSNESASVSSPASPIWTPSSTKALEAKAGGRTQGVELEAMSLGRSGNRSAWSSVGSMKEQPIAYAGSFEPVAGKDRDAMALRDSSGKVLRRTAQAKQHIENGVNGVRGVQSKVWLALWKLVSASARGAKTVVRRAQDTLRATKEMALGFIDEAVQERMQLWELQKHLREATTYARWRTIAEKIDTIKLQDAWRHQNESKLYDWEQIATRLQHLRTLRRQNDAATIAYTLRAGLLRNIGGIDNPRLYEISHVATKKLIDDYNNTVVDLLIYLSQYKDGEDMSIEERLHFFLETRHAFGRTALLLSGGGGMAIYHLGMVRTLMEHGLLPRVISGSSAGSLIGAVVACCTDDELKELFEPGALEFRALAVKDFPNSPSSLYRSISRLVRRGVLFDSEVLKEFVVKYTGEVTFAQAFERTHRVLNVTVTSTRYATGKHGGEGSLLLNYLTSPNVLVWSAVVASCAIPGLFAPGELLALDKDGNVVPYNPSCKSSWCDGSVACDLPAKRLSVLFNINQTIVSQTNPWVVPFVSSSGKSCSDYGWGLRGLWERAKYAVYSEARHRFTLGSELGIIPRNLNWLLNFYFQTYTGDITLVPNIRPKDYIYVLQDPTHDHFEECMLRSQQSSWPKVHLIRARCQIEHTLDLCVERLRKELRLQHAARDQSLSALHGKGTDGGGGGASAKAPRSVSWSRARVPPVVGSSSNKGTKTALGISVINSLDDDREIRDYSPPSRSAVKFFGGR